VWEVRVRLTYGVGVAKGDRQAGWERYGSGWWDTAEKPARSGWESALMGMEGGTLGAFRRVFRPGQRG
jgi:hypothetical protein